MNTQNHWLGDLEEIQNLKLERDQSLIREKVLRDALQQVHWSCSWDLIKSIKDKVLSDQPPTNLIVVDKAEWERLNQNEKATS